MCSASRDGDLESTLTSCAKQNAGGRECVKCKGQAVLVTRIHDAFCKSCFQMYFVHKFRASIGKCKLIRDGEHVLVAYSGGPASSALLHLIHEGRSPRAHRKLRFTAAVIHIDEMGLAKLCAAEREDKLQQIISHVKQRELPLLLTSLEQQQLMADYSSETLPAFSVCWDMDSGEGRAEFQMRTADTTQLERLFDGLGSATVQEEFLRVAKLRLLVAVARLKGFDKVLVGDCSTRLSVRILTDMAQGRGSQVGLDTTIGDKRYGDVMIVRPLRDLNAKEVMMYNVLNHVDSVFVPALTTKTPVGSSIEHLAESFIMGLQAGFPSTVPNIVRIHCRPYAVSMACSGLRHATGTSEKLSQSNEERSCGHCTLCQSPLDTDVYDASALRAVEVSERLSQTGRGTPESGSTEDWDSSALEDVGDAASRSSSGDVQTTLCYGCQLMIKGLDDLSVLPLEMQQSTRTQTHREVMHSQVNEFLLEGN